MVLTDTCTVAKLSNKAVSVYVCGQGCLKAANSSKTPMQSMITYMNQHNPLWTALSKEWIIAIKEILASNRMRFLVTDHEWYASNTPHAWHACMES